MAIRHLGSRPAGAAPRAETNSPTDSCSAPPQDRTHASSGDAGLAPSELIAPEPAALAGRDQARGSAALASLSACRGFDADSGPIESTHAYEGPLGQQQQRSAGGTLITALANDSYAPRTTSRRVVPHDPTLYDYLLREDPGGAALPTGTGDAAHPQNIENMDPARVERQLLAYANDPANAASLAGLGIEDLRRLDPRQAIMLAAQITQDTLSYDKAAWEQESELVFTPAAIELQHALDQRPLERFFEGDSGALCRHYAEVTQGVYQVLKAMQDPADSQLVNSYCKLQDGYKHHWNALYTVQPDGTVAVTQVDSTWNDSGVRGGSDGDDYTFGADGIRDYFRQRTLLEETGKRPLRALLDRFMEEGADWPLDTPELIDTDSVDAAGGMGALSEAIDALPAPLRVDAWGLLDDGARAALAAHRQASGLPPIPTEHPRKN